jgi:hypothetical protein
VWPTQILVEGDSWFDYPVPFFGGGIIPRLEHRLGVPILNLAKAGDEVRYMLGVEERAVLVENLTNGSPARGPLPGEIESTLPKSGRVAGSRACVAASL